MLFNTIDFIIFFIVVLTTIAIIKERKFQHLFLLFASYFFFYYSSNYLITLLIFTTIWDFYFGKAIWKADNIKRKKAMLITSLAGNLGLLGFFKYSDFAITQINFLGQHFDLGTNIPFLNLALPIGISFYTFHSITYTVSIYRGQIQPAKTFVEYAIFVAFFPQLVAGPILRAKDFLPQLREKLDNPQVGARLRQILLFDSNLKLGVTMMAMGFLKKMFFADNIAPMVNEIFGHPVGLNSLTIIIGAIGFGFQIYCDFSGYTDIAIGAALILGFKIPINFNKPYFATSPSDFWRRWHISLSSWLRDYLYVPLGGNRKSHLRTYFNLFAVMFLGGLWHGASWNFVIWGVLHGSYLAIHKAIVNKFPILENNKFFKSNIGKIFSILITQYLIFLAWIAFRVHDFNDMIYSMTKYVFFDFQIQNIGYFIKYHNFPLALMVLFIILSFITYKKMNMVERLSNLKHVYWFGFLAAIILLILFFYRGNPEDFIYFKF
ncbi:MAG TPA: MBOAT family O-acyltransferase [Nitrosopumilaceae archaeon]|nr:MBOAT family O-acyltransferase [Nitrosopumilaceae archaeon]